MIGWRNLDGYVRAAINGNYPDVGQIHYVVDSNFRTAAQGWSRADRTGPLDLWSQRMAPDSSQYVYYTPGTGNPIPNQQTTDRNTIQAAIDAAIDFRGDTVLLTPGSYTLATTALAFNVANMRFLGMPVRNAKQTKVTIDDNIGDNDITADDQEFAFIRALPLTSASFLLASGANTADNTYIHHMFWDSNGVAGDELFQATAAQSGIEVAHCVGLVDTTSTEDILTLTSPSFYNIHDLLLIINGVTWTSAITLLTTPVANIVEHVRVIGGATSSVLTNFITGVADVNMQVTMFDIVINGSVMGTAGDIETTFGTTTDIDIAECYLTGDATGEGGVVIALT